MTDTKKPRVLTEKGIATARLSKKMTAQAFLDKHRPVLDRHAFLQPLLHAYDSKQLLPTPALGAIQSALLSYVMDDEQKSITSKMAAQKAHFAQVQKNYSVILYAKVYNREATDFTVQQGTIQEIEGYLIHTPEGEMVVSSSEVEGRRVIKVMYRERPAIWQADTFQDAMRLADRRLFAREDSVYAIVRNNKGKPIDTRVERSDSIARSLPKKKEPFSRRTSSRSSSLKWHGSAKQDHASFSRG